MILDDVTRRMLITTMNLCTDESYLTCEYCSQLRVSCHQSISVHEVTTGGHKDTTGGNYKRTLDEDTTGGQPSIIPMFDYNCYTTVKQTKYNVMLYNSISMVVKLSDQMTHCSDDSLFR